MKPAHPETILQEAPMLDRQVIGTTQLSCATKVSKYDSTSIFKFSKPAYDKTNKVIHLSLKQASLMSTFLGSYLD